MSNRWRWLTGTNARAADPEFAHYLALTLATATFEGPMLDVLQRFVETFCRVLSGQDDTDSLEVTGAALRKKLSVVRLVDRSFEAAAEMVDEHTSRAWTSPHWEEHLRFLGAQRLPSHAIVGLISGRRMISIPSSRSCAAMRCRGPRSISPARSAAWWRAKSGTTVSCSSSIHRPRVRAFSASWSTWPSAPAGWLAASVSRRTWG